MRRLLRTSSLAAMFALIAASAWAQLSTAQLSGRVTDDSGAVLPGATVTVTQTATGFTRSDVTDGNGAYVLSNLPLGPYRLEVMLQGFRTYVQTGIVLQVGAAPVINAVLGVGALEESVTVQGAAPLVDVQSSGISDVVRNEEILALPLNGRNAAELVVVSGAAVQITTAPNRAVPGGLGISVAGGQAFGVAYLLDGAMHNNPQDNLNMPFPFPDALQEFSVATSGLNAQHGMHSGAAVSAVTKSGTNRFTGNVFEFLRDRRFNATNPFARVGPDGKRVDDGLRRNQFGGTFGGPIVQNKLFFFGAYQGTTLRQQPAANIAYVPTAQMLAGDFTTFASPACNSGRQIALRGGFVDNRIDPARFSPAALNLLTRLPSTTDPCGEIAYTLQQDSNEGQYLGRIDYQRTQDDTIFGRYMATSATQPIPMREGDTVLSLYDSANRQGLLGLDAIAHSLALGDTHVFGPNTVNSLRFAFNRSAVSRLAPATFDPFDLGVDAYSYQPDVMWIEVQGAFFAQNPGPSRFVTNASQVSNDLTLVRGSHQLALGASAAYWRYYFQSHARSGGVWQFTGDLTGRGLSDLLLGRVGRLEHGGPAILPMDQWYVGLYAQDTWRVGPRVTINGGLRWEPYFGQSVRNGAVYNFVPENVRNNVTSQVFVNAPAGLVYPGDDQFATDGRRGVHTQWMNLSPRVGIGWDVSGDGRTAIRASYGLTYDFPNAEYMLINANSPPFGNRSIIADPPGGFDRPYAHLGGNPHPIATNRDTRYLPFGAFGAIDPDINSPRIQQWNVTIERQIGSVWQVAATYLGSHTDRLWNQVALNPGVFLGRDPCTLGGVAYPICSNPGNLNARRVFSLSGENPAAARLIGNLDLHTATGIQDYRGLKLSLQRRGTSLSLNGSYTLSRCYGHPAFQTGGFPQIANGYLDPNNPDFDLGYCDQDYRHIGVFVAGVQTPQFARPALRAAFSDWRLSGILNARSGRPVNIVAGQDRALTGIQNQRVNQVLDNPYGSRKTPSDWLNPAAFAQPAFGTLGTFERNSVRGPAFWTVDMALSRVIPFGETQSLELRAEAFNVFNTFNWGSPVLSQGADRTHHNFNAGTFGRIQSMAGAPRIMQFGIKYGF